MSDQKKRIFAGMLFCLGIVCIWIGLPDGVHPVKAQFGSCGPGFCETVKVSGGGGGCTQATNFINREDGTQTNNAAITTMICGLVTDGVWSSLDALYIFATNDMTNANLNLVSSSYGLTVGHGTCTLTPGAGYTTGGTGGLQCGLSTGFNPSTAGGNFAQNSAHEGFCDYTSGTGKGVPVGVNGATYPGYVDLEDVAGNVQAAINGGFKNLAMTNTQGLWLASRTSSAGVTVYQSNTSLGTTSDISAGVADGPMGVMALGDFNLPSNDEIGFVSFGGGLNSTLAGDYYSRLHTYLTTVGAPSGC